MRRSIFWISIEIALAVASVAAGLQTRSNPAGTGTRVSTGGVAYAIVDLGSGATVSSAEPRELDVPIAPGSTMKIATLVALLESNTITPATKIACTRAAIVGGKSYPCTHPDLHHPLTAAEALAHSCNSFFAQASARLPRRALEAACVSLGLRPPLASADVTLAALGLGGVTETPRQLLEALRRVAAPDSSLAIRPETRRTVIDGLRRAATEGTAAALGEAGIDALAKTGSVRDRTPRGLLVAVTPSARPTRGIVVLVAGGAGRDGVDIAVDQLTRLQAPVREATPRTVRVGFARAAGGYDVQTLPFEDYVARVIAGEAAVRSPEAALDALAITVRTFAAANMGRHARDGFDVCDLTHCQVVRPATEATRASAERTRGRVLQYRGAPAPVYYTASCGGRSELPSSVWPGANDPPFLPSRVDPSCADLPGWTTEIAASDLWRALRQAGFAGDTLRDLRIASRTPSGRAGTIRVDGLTPPTISGQDLRMAAGRTLGWNLIRSTAFDVTRTGSGYRFTGKGSGHGVGLCVLGSVRMALDGASSDTILATYFPGTHAAGSFATAPAPPTNVKVLLPASDEPQRAMIENLAQHLWTTITLRASVTAIGGATLRFHPTVESYRRATGQPWWVAATTTGTGVELLPASVLRDRGILEQTLAHEIAHIVTAPLLDGRPLWVKEGTAVYFASEPRGDPASSRVKCPADNELARSTSPGALRDAYVRAGACVARRIDAGEDWRTIK